MKNAVPEQQLGPALEGGGPVAERAASRALAERFETYADEVRRLVDAGYAVMRRTGELDPRVSDIVREAGLSNQAFYRHFRGKDELLLAILDDGRRRLVTYLERRMATAKPGPDQVRRWIEGVLEQARNRAAAENTRPFVLNAMWLADRFPDDAHRSRELLLAPLRDAVSAAGGDAERDADAIYQLTMGRMQDALVARTRPSTAEVDHTVQFALHGLRMEDT